MAIWNDASGQSYANTSNFGALKLVKKSGKHDKNGKKHENQHQQDKKNQD